MERAPLKGGTASFVAGCALAYYRAMEERPRCYGTYNPGANLCGACYLRRKCGDSGSGEVRAQRPVCPADLVEGDIPADGFHLGYTLGSGQVFRWGRDEDGWWKGIAYGTAFHLRQLEDGKISYRASAQTVSTYAGELQVEAFLRWYLRLDEPPKVRVPRDDKRLRKARDLLRGNHRNDIAF